MIELALGLAAGILYTIAKMPWKWRMAILSNPIIVDVLISILLYALHWGSYSGMMIAAIGSLACSLALGGARWAFGHVESGTYVPGYWDIGERLQKADLK